jgi:hypothetical protein
LRHAGSNRRGWDPEPTESAAPRRRRGRPLHSFGVSTVGVVLIVVLVIVVVLAIGGTVASRRRDDRRAPGYRRHLLEADEALERARAEDKGWDREILDGAARSALERERPGWAYDELHLILVEDREGVEEDRAHLVALAGDSEARVILRRRDGSWDAERVDPAG